MSQGPGSATLPTGIAALRQMRAARRRRYVEQVDLMEVLYRVYLGLIFGGFGLALLAGAIHEAPATPAALEWMRTNLAAVIGLVLAVGVYAGLRTGSRGGPLAIEAAEVQHVLLAPIDRGTALRPAALRQLRGGVLVGLVLGAAIGNFVFRRLPGSPVEWIVALALFGALVPAAVLGAALLSSGRRLRPLPALALGLLLIGWSVADLALGATTSPATMLGELAILPLQSGSTATLAVPGALLALALLALGLLGIGGTLLEAARRRAALVAELRFSASVSDLRTVILLRRQLASERPRRRPWIRLGTRVAARFPVWRRGWQSFLRWPLARIVRVVVVGVAAGALAAVAWSGAIVAFFLPGPLLFVAALDLVEPLAQEADHPTRLELLPVESSVLIGHHLVAPAMALGGVVAIGAVAAAVVGGSAATALGVGAAMLVPSALALACCAAFSATRDPYANVLSPPEVSFALSMVPLLAAAVAIGLPLVVAHAAAEHGSAAVGGALKVAIPLTVVAAVAVPALGYRFSKRGALAA
ncbi:MAG TPA: hypothetical protein VLL27_08480 [Solirubrobacterales bacterium]|nr:hypothetical protein [Solirubrobacterales bacterium]